MTRHPADVATLADELARTGLGWANVPAPMRALGTDLVRALLDGSPLEGDTAAAIAAKHGLDPQVIELAKGQAELDDAGRLVGLGGLSVRPTSHRFLVGGRTLYTWCTLDGLFLAPLLGVTGVIETRCPETGEPIRVEVTPSGVISREPADVVLSVVVPEGGCGPRAATDVRSSFCEFVSFFTSSEALEQHFGERAVAELTLVQGFDLGLRIVGLTPEA